MGIHAIPWNCRFFDALNGVFRIQTVDDFRC
jgi:hypothetical protein